MEDKTLDLSSFGAITSESSKRRAPILAIALVMGTAIPLIIFFPLMSRTPSQASQGEVAHVQVRLGESAKTRSHASEPPDLSSLTSQPATEDSIEEYIQFQPVIISKREFISFGSSARLYEPDFASDKESDEPEYQESHSQISLSDAGKQRYRSERSRFDFQGGFKFNVPERNVELGGAYVDYIKRSFGSPFAPKLSVIEGERELLKGAASNEAIRLDAGRIK